MNDDGNDAEPAFDYIQTSRIELQSKSPQSSWNSSGTWGFRNQILLVIVCDCPDPGQCEGQCLTLTIVCDCL